MDLAKDGPDKVFLGKVADKREDFMGANVVKLRELSDRYVIETCTKLVTINDNKWHDKFSFDRKWVQVELSDRLLLIFKDRSKIGAHLIGKLLELSNFRLSCS